MNYAFTSGYAAVGVDPDSPQYGTNVIWTDGRMGWAAANQWAENLVYGGYDDWRLPTVDPSDTNCSASFDPGGAFPRQYYDYGCTGGELTGLFITDLAANLALFTNVKSWSYWSGTLYAPGTHNAWTVDFGTGWQWYGSGVGNAYYAMAVRSGDVAAPVPEPQTLGLALLALGATVVGQRRRQLRGFDAPPGSQLRGVATV